MDIRVLENQVEQLKGSINAFQWVIMEAKKEEDAKLKANAGTPEIKPEGN